VVFGRKLPKQENISQKLFRFRFNFQISKLNLRFQINTNDFSTDRSFGHQQKLHIKKLTADILVFW
jgi:hypothetical protein